MTLEKYVIAISGFSGAGKSTAIHNLVTLFGNAVALGMDDYTESSAFPPVVQWLANGADPNEFITPKFIEEILSLKERSSEAPQYIIIEEPFGKARPAMRPLIDFHAQISIPPEIALARRIKRILEGSNHEAGNEHLKEFLEWYLRAGRDFYIAVQQKADIEKDLVIDGTLSPEVVAQTIFKAVNAKRESNKS
jgi:uridine kinase